MIFTLFKTTTQNYVFSPNTSLPFEPIIVILCFFVPLIFGYLLGSLNFPIIYSKYIKKQDIRTFGSKNAGATNIMRCYGKKVAFIIFLLDVFKSFLASFILYLVFRFWNADWDPKYQIFFAFPQLGSLGAIIGHIFPVFFKFKGGKGAASLVGLFLSINVLLVVIGVIVFFSIVKIWKYVSLSSLISPTILVFLTFIPWMSQGILGEFTLVGLQNTSLWYVPGIIAAISHLFVFIAHTSCPAYDAFLKAEKRRSKKKKKIKKESEI